MVTKNHRRGAELLGNLIVFASHIIFVKKAILPKWYVQSGMTKRGATLSQIHFVVKLVTICNKSASKFVSKGLVNFQCLLTRRRRLALLRSLQVVPDQEIWKIPFHLAYCLYQLGPLDCHRSSLGLRRDLYQ